MIAQMVLHCRGGIVWEWITDTNQRNPFLVIHHMQSIVLLCGAALCEAVIFKHTINIDSRLELATLVANQLLHALTTRIIKIMGMNRWFRIAHLRAIDPHPIAMIPLEMA